MFMMSKGVFLLMAALSVMTGTSWAERSSNWRVYKKADGLPESACIAVSLVSGGKVLARHLNPPSISQLDGYSVQTIPLRTAGNSRVYGSPSGQLWTVAPGGLQEYREGAWVVHPLPEIANEFRTGLLRLIDPVPLLPVKQGIVIILLPDRLLEFNSENLDHPRIELLRAVKDTRLDKFSGMTLARDGMWIAGARGLAKVPGPLRSLSPATEWQEYVVPESLGIANLQEPHESEDASVIAVGAVTNGAKRVVQFDGQHWKAGPTGPERIRQAWRSADGMCWATTIDGLFQWQDGQAQMVETEEVSARQYFDVAVEPSGTFWLATSEGLFRYAPLAWRAPGLIGHLSSMIHSMAASPAGGLWAVAGGALHYLREDQRREYPLTAAPVRDFQSALGLFALNDGTVVLNIEDQDQQEQVLQFQPDSGVFRLLGSREANVQRRALGLLKDGRLAVQRFGSAPESAFILETLEGQHLESFLEPPVDMVLGKSLTSLFTTQSGEIWLAGEGGTAWYHERKWRTFAAAEQSGPQAALGFVELADGRIWAATPDRIWEFDGRSWVDVRGGFDRINAMVRARDGSVWVASNGGLHHFLLQGNWIENGVEEGLPSAAVRQICEDQRGRIWAGTSRGLALYHPEADPDPPQTVLQELKDKEKNVPEGGTITLSFNAEDKWKYTPRERLLYTYRLDEHDWSAFQQVNLVPFTDLPAGQHYFQVKAIDRNGNLDPHPARLEFAVVLPWYRETRLILISLAGLVGALFFAGLAFNRHRRLVRSYAEVEQKVAERTHELALANRELLHSQKMNALGTLAAGIAHDFNNILSIIKGSAQIIEDNLDNPGKVQTRVDRIKTVVEQGAGIVKAMLGFSRDTDEQPQICELKAVVEDTIRLLGDRFQREVQITFEPAPELPAVSAAKNLIQQILLNFIFNAAESMPKRKEIILSAQRLARLPEDLVLMPAAARDYVALSVRDFGCGIPPENIARIFEPFFTTKSLSARRGTGLGLSMVYELAKKLKGGLAVVSALNQGSTFSLILPVHKLATQAGPLSPAPSQAPMAERFFRSFSF